MIWATKSLPDRWVNDPFSKEIPLMVYDTISASDYEVRITATRKGING